MLKVENLDTGYGRNQILEDLSMEYHEDEMAAVIGPNGAGKSTLFKAIFGMLDVWQGSVHLNSTDLTDMSPAEHLDNQMALVPQGQNVFGNMTVHENLEMGGYGQEKDELKENIEEIYDMFPLLDERKDQKAKSMSGGEQQLLEMGRVLMRDPEIILLDEPSLGLAPSLMDDIFEHVTTIHEEGVGILMIEQNADKALELCDQAYVLDEGHILYEGDASDIRHREDIQKLYLGG